MADTTYPRRVDEQFVRLAEEGQVQKDVLAGMLEPEIRRAYLETCATIERRYTEACDATGDPCLESGCSIDHEAGEVCLQPLLRDGSEYQKEIGAEWVRLYNSGHRD
jgi:hypothetical protein